METKTKQATEAPGAEEAMLDAMNPTLVKEYLKKDLSVAVACLNAILTDEDLLNHMATFMAGRWQNAQTAKHPKQE